MSSTPASGVLLRAGIYGVIRHPRYLSVAIGGIAYALITNYAGVYILALAACPLLYLVALLEERELIDRFGEDYRAYQLGLGPMSHGVLTCPRTDQTARRTILFTQRVPSGRTFAKVSRLLHRCHAHGLIAKVPHSRRWRVTRLGRIAMAASIQLREIQFPAAYTKLAS